MTDGEPLNTLKRLEVELHRTDLWREPELVEELLHEDFEEIGRSGRRYSREEVVAALTACEAQRLQVVAERFEFRRVGERSALLTYLSAQSDASGGSKAMAWRASLWVQSAAGWRLRFHQGTPTSEGLQNS